MKKNFTLIYLLALSPYLAIAQYCMNGGPSSNIDSNVEQVILNGVIGGINYSGCPGTVGIDDRTATTSVTLSAGGSYNAFINFGTCGGNYAGVGQAWIDFDQNGSFDPSESIATWQGTPPGTLTAYNFNVPGGAQNGTTRMRVMQHEGAPGLPLDPCASFTWGSVADFTVILANGLDCSSYRGNNKADAIPVMTYPYRDTNSTYICYSSNSATYISPDVFYMAVLDTLKDSLNVSLCGSDFDTHLAIQDKTGNVIYYNDDYCSSQSEVLFPTTGLDTVYIVVEGWDTSRGTYFLFIDNDYEAIDVGITQLASDQQQVLVYPNPTSGLIQIDGFIPEQTLVFNLAGQQVLPPIIEKANLDLTDLPSGVYFLLMQHERQLYRQKIIKK